MLNGHGGELVTKDQNAQHRNSIYLSPDRTEIYLIGGICLLYVYKRKIDTGGKGAWKPMKTS